MQYNFINIRTDKGWKFSNKILSSIKWINEHKYPQHTFETHDMTLSDFLRDFDDDFFGDVVQPENTIIHPRCANPRTDWTIKLRELQEKGYKVVNSVDTIELTSNKLACSLHLQGKVNHPKSWEWKRNETRLNKEDLIDDITDALIGSEYLIAKPLTSLEQGANVKKIRIGYGSGNTWIDIMREIESVPGNKIVIQEYIPYTALHRVIVIGGKALPYTFIDKPEWHPNDWKVSCCLNRTTMKLNENADGYLLKLAEDTQKAVGGVINFIDIFEYEARDGMSYEYTNAEINTACSLNIHERLAKQANRRDWNIHFRIARQLVKELLGG